MAKALLLSEVVAEYLLLQTNRSSSATAAADNNVLRMFLRISGDRVAKNLNADHIEKFFYGKGGIRENHISMSRRTRTETLPGVSDATHNHYRSRVKSFVTWAVNKGYFRPGLVADAFDKSHGAVRPLKVHKEPRQRPSPVELMGLLEVADNPRDRIYLAAAINTALRSSELRGLLVGAVNLASGSILVRIYKTGDRDEQPITADLDAELRRWLNQYALDLGRPLQPEDHLFPARTGGLISHYEETSEGTRICVRRPYHWQPHKYIKETHLIVQKALRALGKPTEKEGTHTIRRAVARAYFDAVAQEVGDVSALRETAALLHHSSVVTTELYLGTTPEKENRDRRLRGKAFLSGMIEAENVVQLRPVAEGE